MAKGGQSARTARSMPIGLVPYSDRKSLAYTAKVRVGQEIRVSQLVRRRVTAGQDHQGSQSVTVGSSQVRGHY